MLKFADDDTWNNTYNLADIIRFQLKKGLLFPQDSIAFQYINNCQAQLQERSFAKLQPCVEDVNFNLLSNILKNKSPEYRSNHYHPCLSIGLRLGDMITDPLTPKPQEILDFILENNLHKKINSCALLWGLHYDFYSEESQQYILKLQSLLTPHFTLVHSPGTVDGDLIFGANSLYYIAASRGFGWLTGCLNMHTVYWRFNDLSWESIAKYYRQLQLGKIFLKKNRFINENTHNISVLY